MIPDLVAIAGAENLKNVFFTNHYSSQDPSEKVQSFVQAYKAKYEDMPDSFAALGYDAAWWPMPSTERVPLILEAIECLAGRRISRQ